MRLQIIFRKQASNRKGAGIRIVLITPEKLIMEKSLRLGFLATNNETEYEALLVGVAMVRQLRGEVVSCTLILDWSWAKSMETLKLGMRGCRGTLLRCKVLGLSLRVLY